MTDKLASSHNHRLVDFILLSVHSVEMNQKGNSYITTIKLDIKMNGGITTTREDLVPDGVRATDLLLTYSIPYASLTDADGNSWKWIKSVPIGEFGLLLRPPAKPVKLTFSSENITQINNGTVLTIKIQPKDRKAAIQIVSFVYNSNTKQWERCDTPTLVKQKANKERRVMPSE